MAQQNLCEKVCVWNEMNETLLLLLLLQCIIQKRKKKVANEWTRQERFWPHHFLAYGCLFSRRKSSPPMKEIQIWSFICYRFPYSNFFIFALTNRVIPFNFRSAIQGLGFFFLSIFSLLWMQIKGSNTNSLCKLAFNRCACLWCARWAWSIGGRIWPTSSTCRMEQLPLLLPPPTWARIRVITTTTITTTLGTTCRLVTILTTLIRRFTRRSPIRDTRAIRTRPTMLCITTMPARTESTRPPLPPPLITTTTATADWPRPPPPPLRPTRITRASLATPPDGPSCFKTLRSLHRSPSWAETDLIRVLDLVMKSGVPNYLRSFKRLIFFRLI